MVTAEVPSKPHTHGEEKPFEDHKLLREREYLEKTAEESKFKQARDRLDSSEGRRKASQEKDRDSEKEREKELEEREKEKLEIEEEKTEKAEAEEASKELKATKLLDELFRKTKATPCIYWLPLTDAQVSKRVRDAL